MNRINFNKRFIFRQFTFLVFVIIFHNVAFNQQIHPKIQEQIDSMQVWMQNEMKTKGAIDQDDINKWNEKIKLVKEQVKNEEDSRIETYVNSEEGEMIKKSGVAGSSWIVPDDEIWKVTNIGVIDGLGGYEISVKSIELPKIFMPGERLQNPTFVPEAALLTQDQTVVTYKYTIFVTKMKQ